MKPPTSSTRAGASGAIRSEAADCLASPLLNDRACFDALNSRIQAQLPAFAQSATQAAPCTVPEQLAYSTFASSHWSRQQESTWLPLALTGPKQWYFSAYSVAPSNTAALSPLSQPSHTPFSAFHSSHSPATSPFLLSCRPQLPILHQGRSSSNPPSRSKVSTALPPGRIGHKVRRPVHHSTCLRKTAALCVRGLHLNSCWLVRVSQLCWSVRWLCC